MADPGAAEIKSLLDTPSASLGELMVALVTAMSEAQHDNHATVPPSTFTIVGALCAYYRDLGDSVQSISTRSPAKEQVLAALAEIDSGLVSLTRALHQGTSDQANTDLAAAEQQSAEANRQLVRASNALS